MNRRADPSEARARQLATEAGQDPDARVPHASNPKRTAPLWTTWRDAAKAAMDAERAAETAQEIASLRPQAPRYRDAPLRVFGEHEESTLAQMRNCMGVGNAVAGVICADGHLGYAQPVGGVIAYEGQISVSGVGFDIGCLTGDTRIFTLDGQTPTLAESEGRTVWVLACDPGGRPVPAQAVCRRTRRDAALVRVTLDSGKAIHCTPDHLFMLRDGTYRRADALVPGQSLMPLYTAADTDGHALVRDNQTRRLVRLDEVVRRAGLVLPYRETFARQDNSPPDPVPTCRAAGADNHEVVSVEAVVERENVFCLSVPGLNNFALADGVFVHNCGNMAVRLDVPYHAIRDRVPAILGDIRTHVSFGVGRTNDERVEHPLLDDAEAWRASGMEDYRQKARAQLGTVGSGNHYVDLMADEQGLVWIGVHFGSRGLGHTSATRYLKLGGGKDGIHVPPTVLDEDGELGQRYLAAMELAGRYAYAGREWVVERVRRIVGGAVTETVHNHHNYAWRESYGGRDVWVVRKGATPAFPGQRGFVGGSMGDDAVILEGVEGEASVAALHSTVHGAGRVFGRKEAKRRFTRAQMDEWLRGRGVLLAGGDLDESPMAYRRLPDVLAHHAGTIKVVHTLRPFAVAMAGRGVEDPFKD